MKTTHCIFSSNACKQDAQLHIIGTGFGIYDNTTCLLDLDTGSSIYSLTVASWTDTQILDSISQNTGFLWWKLLVDKNITSMSVVNQSLTIVGTGFTGSTLVWVFSNMQSQLLQYTQTIQVINGALYDQSLLTSGTPSCLNGGGIYSPM